MLNPKRFAALSLLVMAALLVACAAPATAPTAARRMRSTDGDPCTNHRRGSHRNRSSATCNTSLAKFRGTSA